MVMTYKLHLHARVGQPFSNCIQRWPRGAVPGISHDAQRADRRALQETQQAVNPGRAIIKIYQATAMYNGRKSVPLGERFNL